MLLSEFLSVLRKAFFELRRENIDKAGSILVADVAESLRDFTHEVFKLLNTRIFSFKKGKRELIPGKVNSSHVCMSEVVGVFLFRVDNA